MLPVHCESAKGLGRRGGSAPGIQLMDTPPSCCYMYVEHTSFAKAEEERSMEKSHLLFNVGSESDKSHFWAESIVHIG